MGKVYCVFRDDPPPVDGERGVRWPKLVDLTGQEVDPEKGADFSS